VRPNGPDCRVCARKTLPERELARVAILVGAEFCSWTDLWPEDLCFTDRGRPAATGHFDTSSAQQSAKSFRPTSTTRCVVELISRPRASPPNGDFIDVRWEHAGVTWIGEVKLSRYLTAAEAFRIALGQLLVYGATQFSEAPGMVMFLDEKPGDALLRLAERLGVVVRNRPRKIRAAVDFRRHAACGGVSRLLAEALIRRRTSTDFQRPLTGTVCWGKLLQCGRNKLVASRLDRMTISAYVQVGCAAAVLRRSSK
jgi:hypothetical protein